MDKESQPVSVSQYWLDIVAMFSTRAALKVKKVWVTGISARLGKHRISDLLNTKQAQQLKMILEKISNNDVKALRTYAAINQEQAVSAFKVTMVANVTFPIGFLALLHQLSPTGLSGFILSTYGESDIGFLAFIIASIFVAIGVLSIAVYALANLNQARDIRHLIDLHAAERGIYFGLEDMDDLNLT